MTRGLGIRLLGVSRPSLRLLPLRPDDSLTTPKDGFVDGLPKFGFPSPGHPSYRAADFCPGGFHPPAEYSCLSLDIRATCLIRRGPFHMIDDENLNWTFGGNQLQAKLFLERGED